MTLHPGTGKAYSGSLGEAIEAAFAGELFALRASLLPTDEGKDDRRLLFAAIAQGVLQYLAVRHASNVTVTLPSSPGGETLDVDFAVPTLTWSAGVAHGAGFPPGTVTLRVLRAGGATTTAIAAGGTFSQPISGIPGDVVDARDGAGNAAQAVIA